MEKWLWHHEKDILKGRGQMIYDGKTLSRQKEPKSSYMYESKKWPEPFIFEDNGFSSPAKSINPSFILLLNFPFSFYKIENSLRHWILLTLTVFTLGGYRANGEISYLSKLFLIY